MHNLTDKGLLFAAATALATALLLQIHFVAGCGFTAVATALAMRGRAFLPCLAALPTLLAALPMPERPANQPSPGPVVVEGRLVSSRRDLELGTTTLEVRTDGGLQRLSVAGPIAAYPGDRIRAIARCSESAILDETNPVQAAVSACEVERGPFSFPSACARLAEVLQREVGAIGGPRHEAFLTALTLGGGARAPADVAAAHRATGLSHLLAVSGAHAAMLAWLLGLQPFSGGRRRPVGRAHLWSAMATLLVYGAVTGMEPPMFRALCGYTLVAIGLRMGRQTSTAQALLWPALFSAVVAPGGLLCVSFCLSYAAVAGLALAGPPRSRSWFERFVAAPVRASFWATACTAPLTLAFFSQLAPWTILLTPLLSPLVAALLLACLLGAALGAVGLPVVWLLQTPVEAVADAYLCALAVADSLPCTPVHATCSPSTATMCAFVAIAAWILVTAKSRGRVLLAATVLCAPHFLPPPHETARVEIFAVGHGQCCLVVLDDGTTAMVDCGSQQRPALPAHKVERALRRRRIDALVLTHGDFDHTGGVAALARRMPIGLALLPEAMRGSPTHALLHEEGAEVRFLAAGETDCIAEGLEAAAPPLADASDNDGSLWVRARLRGWSLLLTGDAEEAGCDVAIAHGLAQPADVLVLPHHGRPNALGERLIDTTQPAFCLVSNDRGDGCSALGSLAMARGVPTFATATCGDLTVEGDGAPRVRAAAMQAMPR
jgi:competence protein ComEC